MESWRALTERTNTKGKKKVGEERGKGYEPEK